MVVNTVPTTSAWVAIASKALAANTKLRIHGLRAGIIADAQRYGVPYAALQQTTLQSHLQEMQSAENARENRVDMLEMVSKIELGFDLRIAE